MKMQKLQFNKQVELYLISVPCISWLYFYNKKKQKKKILIEEIIVEIKNSFFRFKLDVDVVDV